MPSSMLDEECRAFTLYLIGKIPSDYVLEKYRQAHVVTPMLAECEEDRFGGLLLKLARSGRTGLTLVDAYASIFRKDVLVRKKLILLLSILESCGSSYSTFETPESGSKTKARLLLVSECARAVLTFVLATALLLPLQWLCRGSGRAAAAAQPAPERPRSLAGAGTSIGGRQAR